MRRTLPLFFFFFFFISIIAEERKKRSLGEDDFAREVSPKLDAILSKSQRNRSSKNVTLGNK
jgi:hypothetical protein